MSIANSVALVSELSVNESHSPQQSYTVSLGRVPAAHWDKEITSTDVRSDESLNERWKFFEMGLNMVKSW